MIISGKQRKVWCQLSAENVAVYVGCLNRGVACVVQQVQREDEILGAAHLDEKLDRIELLLKRLVENAVSSGSGAAPSATTVNPSSAPANYVPSIANNSSLEESCVNDSLSDNVIVSCTFSTTSTNIYSQIIRMESIHHVSKTALSITGSR